MSYPPEFSNVLTYENRLDLDKLDVFLEGDGTNPMFFNIEGLPPSLSFGKHYFNISLLDSTHQDYTLRRGSKIIFEFKSKNNVVLKSDVAKVNQKNGLITAFVEVLKDPLRTFEEVKDGNGVLNVCAMLTNKETTPVNYRIPNEYLDRINYRCTFPIDVRKNLINANSPRILQTSHKLTTTQGQFSFSKASISTRRGSSGGQTYLPDGTIGNFTAPGDDSL